MEYKRPSGSRPAARNDYCAGCYELRTIVLNLQGRLGVIDGNGNPMAEGGFVGRMKRQHESNQKMLRWILGLLLTLNLGVWGDIVERMKK